MMWVTRNLLSKHMYFYNQERNVKNNQCYFFIYFFPFGHPCVKITLGSMTSKDSILYTRKDTFTV